MKLVCPSCHATHSAEAWSSDADARMALLVAAELPSELGAVAIRYLGLFRPASRGLAWSRVRKLLDELATMIKAGSIRRSGRDWPAPPAAFRAAMQRMLDKRDDLDLPLDGHGYLLSILAGEANKAEAKAERSTEESRRTGRQAAPVDDESQRQIERGQIRTAVLLLRTETKARQRFGETLDQDAAAELLRKREFGESVVTAALRAYFPS